MLEYDYPTYTVGSATVETILKSKNPQGVQLTTLHLHYPRIIHAELMTHRVFSRNASSSRAIPVKRMLEHLERNMYIPEQMYYNVAGMHGDEPMTGEDRNKARAIWEKMARTIIEGVSELQALNMHKQHTNRPLEWFSYIDVLVSSVYWDNFFTLRDDYRAQPEIQDLAQAIKYALADNDVPPQQLKLADFHRPYIRPEDPELIMHQAKELQLSPGEYDLTRLLNITSVSRCCRVSYMRLGEPSTLADDLRRYSSLLGPPIHATPFEHVALADDKNRYGQYYRAHQHGNFVGFIQLRKLLTNEAVMEQFK